MTRLKKLLYLALALPGVAAAANLGIIDGTVREYTGEPIAAARVALVDRGGRRVDEHTTRLDGHFEFEQVPFGQYRLVVTTADGRTETQTLRVTSGEVVRTEVFPALMMEEQVVVIPTPKAPEPPKVASSTTSLEREDIKELPRGDTASVNEVLATQPGFVYDAFGNLYARGNHANIQYQMDGVPLPDSVSGLFGGFLSPKFIENMEVITGGLPAEYGERLAAVVNLNSRRPTEAGEGELDLAYGSFDTVSPSLLYGKRIGKLSFLGGGSFRLTERALDPQAVSPILHDRGDEERGFARIDYDLGDSDHLSWLATFASNRYQIPLDPTLAPCDTTKPDCGRSPDQYGNSPPPFFPRDTDSTETERDLFSMLSYRHDYGPRSSVRLAAYYRYSYGFLYGDAAHALGPTQDPCTNPTDPTTCASTSATTSDVARRANHAGGIAEYLVRLGEDHVLRVGGKIDQLFGTTDFTSYTRNDTLRGPDPSLTLSGTDKANATSGGLYVSDRATFGELIVNAGIRLDFQKVSFEGTPEQATQVGWGPRLGVAYAFTSETVAHAFAGLLWMPPTVLDTPAAARILGVVPPGQPIAYDLKPENDRYAEVGIESRVLPQLTLKATAWGKLSTDQLDDVGVGSTNLVSPYNFSEGRAGGIEAGAVAVLSSWLNAFANGALSKAQGREIASARYLFSPADLANKDWQSLDHAQTWTANGGATVHDGGTQVSALVSYGSGLRTGPLNDQHVPGHVRLDATLAHQFLSAPGRPTFAIDVVNLLDARYPYRIANGFNGSHWAPERSVYLRLALGF